jgi:hypothetical protein
MKVVNYKMLRTILNINDMNQKEYAIKLLMKGTSSSPLGEGWVGVLKVKTN